MPIDWASLGFGDPTPTPSSPGGVDWASLGFEDTTPPENETPEERRKRLAKLYNPTLTGVDPLARQAKLSQIAENSAIGDQQATDLGVDHSKDVHAPSYLANATAEFSIGPALGLAEWQSNNIRKAAELAGVPKAATYLPLVPSGARAQMRSSYDQAREGFLNLHPSAGGAVAATALDAAGMIPGMFGAGKFAKAGAALADAAGLSPLAVKAATIGGSGLEGAALGYGNAVDLPESERLKQAGIGGALGLGFGGLEAVHPPRVPNPLKPTLTDRYFLSGDGIPLPIRKIQDAHRGLEQEAELASKLATDDVNREIRKITGLFDSKKRAEIDGNINVALQGDHPLQAEAIAKLQDLSPHLVPLVGRLRSMQDAASSAAFKSLAGGDGMAQNLASVLDRGATPERIREVIHLGDPHGWSTGRYARLGGEEMVTVSRNVPPEAGDYLRPYDHVWVGESSYPAYGEKLIRTKVPARELMAGDEGGTVHMGGQARWVPRGHNPDAARFSNGQRRSYGEVFGPTETHPNLTPEEVAFKMAFDQLPVHRQVTLAKYIDSAATVRAKSGDYINRSYQIYDGSPGYRKALPDSQRYGRMIDWLQKENKYTLDQAENAAKKMIFEAASEGTDVHSNIEVGPLKATALDALKKRKDIPQVMRDFLGEEKDWRLNVNRGVTKASHIAQGIEMYNQILDEGMGTLLDVSSGPSKIPEFSYALKKGHRFNVPEGSNVWTTPELGAVLEGSDLVRQQAHGSFMDAASKANSAVKFGVTADNPATQAVNSIGNVFLGLATGHYSLLWNYPIAVAKYAKVNLAKSLGFNPKLSAAEEAFQLESARYGISQPGGMYGDVHEGLQSATQRKLSTQPHQLAGQDPGSKVLRAIGEAARKTVAEAPAAFYDAPDIGLKQAVWPLDAQELMKAYPEKSMDEIKTMAAARTKATVPNPSSAPKAVQIASRTPLVGPFVTFVSETARTSANNIKIGAMDIAEGQRTGNNQLKYMGVKRLSGVLGMLGAMAAIPKAATLAFGQDPKDGEVIRGLGRDWEKTATPIVVKRDKGKITYIDFGRFNAYGQLMKPAVGFMSAILRGDPNQKAAEDAFFAAAEPYINPEIIPGLVTEVAINKNHHVFNPESSAYTIAGDVASKAFSSTAPGVAKQGQRLLSDGKPGAVPTSTSPAQAAWELAGIRMATLDVTAAINQKVRFEIVGKYNDAMSIVSKAKRTTSDPNKIATARAEAQQSWNDTFRTLTETVRLGRQSGLTDDEIYVAMTKDSGLNRMMIRGALLGQNPGLRFHD